MARKIVDLMRVLPELIRERIVWHVGGMGTPGQQRMSAGIFAAIVRNWTPSCCCSPSGLRREFSPDLRLL